MPYAPTTAFIEISGPGIQPYSARGLQQSLEPISAAVAPRRTVNGVAVDVSGSQFHLYRSSIACSDVMAPALDGVFPGLIVSVKCAAHLSYPTSGGSPARPVVSGSSFTQGAYTFYRPELEMIVTGLSVTRDEYGAVTSWQLDLEEVGEEASA